MARAADKPAVAVGIGGGTALGNAAVL